MRDVRRPRGGVLRGALLFVLGVLVGANVVYFVLTRTPAATGIAPTPTPGTDAAAADGAAPASAVAPIETPPVPPSPASPAESPAVLPATTTDATGSLLIPVQGIAAAALHDTFNDARSEGRRHDAIDIMAPAGTPVLAVADGRIEKLFLSDRGGITLYQFNPARTRAYYYAHLQRYADGIAEGQALRRGQVLGYVGATGNADPSAPHLHFAVFALGPEARWWEGAALNPYPMLVPGRG
ncbi:M23 family metallopeptidase [Thermomonas mangrovi]|uniref:M23 family metallopeptidase n=1 Tax=Thermomonas mangrovi TaxID=2993316 RepID=UPI002306F92F|nr:M23 family metallopeptidase [Thermomonas mangrovi]